MSILDDKLEMLMDLDYRKTYRKIEFFRPYAKQQQFFDLGLTKRERLFMAGNRVGKTESGAYETAVHLTGLYADDWLGRRFNYPTKGWAAGETSLATRNVPQAKLCGLPGVTAGPTGFGTGLIPKDLFVDKPSISRGVTDALDTIQVKHVGGHALDDSAISTLSFKSYEQGRTKFQGDALDFGWCDEEPDLELYNEFLTRMAPTTEHPDGGILYTTLTPLLGPTLLVQRFQSAISEDRAIVTMTIDEVVAEPHGHFTRESADRQIAGYEEHERDARRLGKPLLGSGAVFSTSEESIVESAIAYIPEEWVKIWGIDFGISQHHKFAATLLLWDREVDIMHVHASFKIADTLPVVHASMMRGLGINVPVAWPHDGTQRDKQSGRVLQHAYRDQGLKMLHEHATHEEGGYSTEAGVKEMGDRLRTGRLKVASHLSSWREEYRFYHRKHGLIERIRDDEMSATRMAVMMRRYARAVQLGGRGRRRSGSGIAQGVDFDLFA